MGKTSLDGLIEITHRTNSPKAAKVIENLLEKRAGFLFDGVRLDAPAEFKKPIE